ncbi:hypothetical protein HMN09_01163300 [Mycena chlorophos]|uniref:Uncharacterized protein n=1 Tax=Mycena chlorophos TaxID=658473 RepID=A0A8H6S8Z7_MYCCL|nr:hypothetical protein HMN09_01163300 [Mycena chlorophos]
MFLFYHDGETTSIPFKFHPNYSSRAHLLRLSPPAESRQHSLTTAPLRESPMPTCFSPRRLRRRRREISRSIDIDSLSSQLLYQGGQESAVQTLSAIIHLSSTLETISQTAATDRLFRGNIRMQARMAGLLKDVKSLSDFIYQRPTLTSNTGLHLLFGRSRYGQTLLRELQACVNADLQHLAATTELFHSLRDEYEQIKVLMSDALDRIACNGDGVSGPCAPASVSAATAKRIRDLFSETDCYFAAVARGLRQRERALRKLLQSDACLSVPDPPHLTVRYHLQFPFGSSCSIAQDAQVEQNASSIVSGLGSIVASMHATDASQKLATGSGALTTKADELRVKCVRILPQVATAAANAAPRTTSVLRRFFVEDPLAKLRKSVHRLVGEYSKLQVKVDVYRITATQFLWFAGSTEAEKRADDRMAEDVVESAWSYSRNSSPYLRPLEFALSDVEKELRGWTAALRCYLEGSESLVL